MTQHLQSMQTLSPEPAALAGRQGISAHHAAALLANIAHAGAQAGWLLSKCDLHASLEEEHQLGVLHLLRISDRHLSDVAILRGSRRRPLTPAEPLADTTPQPLPASHPVCCGHLQATRHSRGALASFCVTQSDTGSRNMPERAQASSTTSACLSSRRPICTVGPRC